MPDLYVTAHARSRFRERVGPELDGADADGRLVAFLERAAIRPTPRKWVRKRIAVQAGRTYAFHADSPDVVAILQGPVVLTFLTRSVGRREGSKASAHLPPGLASPVSPPPT